jgi:tetratricopeptide (TPR) repeat protein
MRARLFLFFILLTGVSFSQTDRLLAEFEELPADSVHRATIIKDLLKTTIRFEFSDDEAYEKFGEVGMLCYSQNQNNFAVEFFQEALEIAKNYGDSDKIAKMLSNIGVINEMKGDYSSALINYQKSLEAFIDEGNVKSQSLVYNNISIVHQELGNIDLAYQNLKKSYDLKLSINDSSLIASALNNFGVFYEESKQDLDSALFYYQKSLDIYQKIRDERNEAICFNNIALVFFKKKDYENARNNFRISIDRFRYLDDNLWLSKALLYLAQLELESSNAYVAVELLEEAKMLVFATDYSNGIMEISQTLADAYYKTSKFEKSAAEYNFLETLKDSLINIEKQNEISKLEIKFQSVQKQHEIDNLQIEKEIQQRKLSQVIYTFVGIGLFLAFIIVFLYMNGRHRKLFMQNKNLATKQQLLQNQMNPHFLFNVLTSIQSYISASDSDNASLYLSKFSRLTRMVLQSSANDKILLSDEIELLTNYMTLEHLRSNKSFEFKLIISNEIEAEEIEIPPMMIQPFIENAIKHGVSKVENGIVELYVEQKDDHIQFSIIDNGPGFEKNNITKSEHKSMALSIIEERIQILKQKCKKSVMLRYENIEKGTKIVIALPII